MDPFEITAGTLMVNVVMRKIVALAGVKSRRATLLPRQATGFNQVYELFCRNPRCAALRPKENKRETERREGKGDAKT